MSKRQSKASKSAKQERQTGKRGKSAPPKEHPQGWIISTEYRANGRVLEPGTEVSITGERGRFRFVRHVISASGAEWIDVVGGANKVTMYRSFRPDRVKRVHRLAKTREGQAAKAAKAQGKAAK